jgi:hypothetical protein
LNLREPLKEPLKYFFKSHLQFHLCHHKLEEVRSFEQGSCVQQPPLANSRAFLDGKPPNSLSSPYRYV